MTSPSLHGLPKITIQHILSLHPDSVDCMDGASLQLPAFGMRVAATPAFLVSWKLSTGNVILLREHALNSMLTMGHRMGSV